MGNRRLVRWLGLAALALLAGRAVPSSAQSAGWTFTYPADTARPGAMLDLRYLNEAVAGESGFVRLSPDGNSFVLGNGKPARFWAVGSDLYRGTPEEMDRHARFLARMGVNMVRLHTQIAPDGDAPGLTDVNEKEIDGIQRFVAALKKQGIYSTISPYWANAKPATKWNIAGYTGKADLWGLLFFDENLQTGYKAWVRALYTRKNPYTGISLAQDPSVAIIQVQNEDSLFFWTMMGLKPEQQARLGAKFGAWLTTKYGSLPKAQAAWGGLTHPNDHFAEGQVGLENVYQMTQDQSGGMAARVRDEVQFLAETQRGFYQMMASYYHKDLGCKQLINASNWITADPIRLNDIERYTYTAADVLAVNRYYEGGQHIGPNNGWRIDPGDHFSDISALLNPRDLPTNLKQVVGHPMMITESTWVAPLGFQAEGPLLMAAYESLTGVSAFYWFSATRPEYDSDPYFNFININSGGVNNHAMQKWTASVPSIIGNFPANAILYRTNAVAQGAAVVHEERPLNSLWERQIPMIAEDRSFDPNRDSGTGTQQSNLAKGVDPLAFLVGRVEVKFGGDQTKSHAVDLAPYIHHDTKTVQSITGELKLDYGKGLFTVRAPRAQAACGFLKTAGPQDLGDVALDSGNDYASIVVVSMDGQPIRASHKILVQVGTRVRPLGWKQTPATFNSADGKQTFQGFTVETTGGPRLVVASTDLTMTVRNSGLTKATLLDPAGHPVHALTPTIAGGSMKLKLPADAMYVILE